MGAFKEIQIGIAEDRERYGYSLKEIAARNNVTINEAAECLVDYYRQQICEVKKEFKQEVLADKITVPENQIVIDYDVDDGNGTKTGGKHEVYIKD